MEEEKKRRKLTETWLKHSTPDRDIELNSFSVPLRKERVESSYAIPDIIKSIAITESM
jgi:hypothetical protein